MDAREASSVLAQCKWLRDQIKAAEDQAKAVMLQHHQGGERINSTLPDGTNLGAVVIAQGGKSMSIDNPDGFLYWVKQRYPTEVVETVRDSFVKVCAEKVKVLGGLPDANGEMCPHVSLVQGDPKVTVNLSKLADGIMQDVVSRKRVGELLAPPQDSITYEMIDGLIVPDNPLLPPSEPEPELSQGGTVDPEPFIEEGPPNWRESNTFETTDAVRQRRGQ